MKDEKLTFRLSRVRKKTIFEIAELLDISPSKLCDNSLGLLIKEFKELPDGVKKDLLLELERSSKYKDVVEEWKQYSRNGFLLKYTAKNILDKANTQLFFGGEINMIAVKKEIKYAEKIYNLFDEESKKIFEEDLFSIKKFESKIYLMEKLQQINKINKINKMLK